MFPDEIESETYVTLYSSLQSSRLQFARFDGSLSPKQHDGCSDADGFKRCVCSAAELLLCPTACRWGGSSGLGAAWTHSPPSPVGSPPPRARAGLEVRWFLPGGGFDSPVLLYQRAHLEHGSQTQRPAGLREGDVSLKLANVTLQDAGDYSCYVSSDKEYDTATVSLVVTVTGTPPLLSAVWDNGRSGEPELLRWADPLKPLTPQSLQYSNRPLRPGVGAQLDPAARLHPGVLLVEEQEVRLKLQEPPQGSEGGAAAGWAAFGLLLSAVLLAAAFLLYRKRGKKAKLPVEGKIEPTQISTARQSYVNVKPEHNGNEYLKIVENKIRDQQINFPDGDQVTFLTAITGTPSLSSGRHYWEVSLGNSKTELKKFWWVGVTTASIRADSHLTPSSSNGFWFLSSSPTSLQLSTESSVALLPLPGPQTLGVFLDFDRGELSFYNVEKQSLICSLTAAFTVPLFPLFNPGKGDTAPMELLQRKVEAEQGGGNTESKAVCETEAGSG
ncbi:hypothetical protein KUCAC02_000808 [Chaenocephalus aceratus]|uniref:Uncharacterized protein n=1 Tax=Chaenocephalus aceratus TaxID=36190 RepID=A0ACB9W8F5_CHAAC|nr:hypothetical protein KUCAC02_000808 [Chaenocephalus aceratus]